MLTRGGATWEVVADVVADWEEISQIPLAGVQAPRPQSQRVRDTDVLDEIPPAEYVRLLAGVEVPHHGVINCPLPDHEERTPSFKAYDDPDRGWFCYGCARGGTIFDFAAALWGMSTRGSAFVELRRELARALLRGSA